MTIIRGASHRLCPRQTAPTCSMLIHEAVLRRGAKSLVHSGKNTQHTHWHSPIRKRSRMNSVLDISQSVGVRAQQKVNRLKTAKENPRTYRCS